MASSNYITGLGQSETHSSEPPSQPTIQSLTQIPSTSEETLVNDDTSMSRFDLGGEGRTAWYVPTERTVFPRKKGAPVKGDVNEYHQDQGVKVARESRSSCSSPPLKKGNAQDHDRGSGIGGNQLLDSHSDSEEEETIKRTRERHMDSGEESMTNGNGKPTYDAPRLRTRRSLEEEVARIENAEMRRLTGVAYLS